MLLNYGRHCHSIKNMISKSQVKYIQSLNEKKFRNQENVFVAEGPKLIKELLAADNIETVALYAIEEWWRAHETLQEMLPSAECYNISENELKRISFLVTPKYVAGIFKQPVFPTEIPFSNSLSLLLDSIQDPGNMGTIVRIADWFGIKQIIASFDSVDVFNPKVVQSTMGSMSRVKLVYNDIVELITRQHKIPVYASTLYGKPLATFGKIKEGLLLIGNESKGINEQLIRLAKHELTIPKFGSAESLNAAVATGIILSHIV